MTVAIILLREIRGRLQKCSSNGTTKKMKSVIILVCLSIPEFQVPRVLNWCVFLLEVVPLLFFFLVTTTHRDPFLSLFILFIELFWGLFFQYSCCRCRRYIYLVPPFGCHRSGLFFSSRDSIRRYRWWVDNRKLTHDTVIVLLPSLSLSH